MRDEATGLRIFAGIAAALFLASPLLTARLDPNGYAGGRSRDVQARAIRNSSAVAIMLGQFRTAMSDIMYIKTERYLDNGVGYMPHLKEKLSISGQAAAIDEHQAEVAEQQAGHDHDAEHGHEHHGDEDGAGTATLIPTADKDFRGIIGHLEREVKPWRDPTQPHNHSDGTELLPWFRLMTLSDPHYVLGYTVGGWWLKSRNLEAAIKFAQEGIAKNPGEFQVYFTLGQLYLTKARAMTGGHYVSTNLPPEALACFRQAHDLYIQAANLVMAKRPADIHAPGWGDYTEEDALATCRLAVLSEWHYGDRNEAVRMARQYLAVFKQDILLERLAAREP